MSGLEAIQKIRDLGFETLIVFFRDSSTRSEHITPILQNGANICCFKPETITELKDLFGMEISPTSLKVQVGGSSADLSDDNLSSKPSSDIVFGGNVSPLSSVANPSPKDDVRNKTVDDLPERKHEEEKKESAPNSPTQGSTTPANLPFGRELRILLVEDSMANSKMIQRMIQSWGCTAIPAFNGKEAVTKFEEKEHFDVVLMDKEMPGKKM
jgi:hypothetical protein